MRRVLAPLAPISERTAYKSRRSRGDRAIRRVTIPPRERISPESPSLSPGFLVKRNTRFRLRHTRSRADGIVSGEIEIGEPR